MSIKEQKDAIMVALRAIHVHEITASGSGSGDSGQVDFIEAKDTDQDEEIDLDKSHAEIEVVYEESVQNPKTKKYVKIKKKKLVQLKEAVNNFIDDAVGETGVDWYNNDGGTFELKLDVKTGNVEIRMGQHRTETDYTEFTY